MTENRLAVTVEKRDRKYKWRFLFYRRVCVYLSGVIILLVSLLFWTLRGNARLQRDSVITIAPEVK